MQRPERSFPDQGVYTVRFPELSPDRPGKRIDMERETREEEMVEQKEKVVGGKKEKRKIISERDYLEPKKMESRESSETAEREM